MPLIAQGSHRRVNVYTYSGDDPRGFERGMTFDADSRPSSNVLPVKVNILVDQDGHARLADFGLLTIISDQTGLTTSSSPSTGGTTRWMSPELLHPERFGYDNGCRPTKESDCYALGMVIYEVLTGQPPFPGLRDHIIIRIVPNGERPGRPEGVKGTWFTDDLWKMLGLCWSTDTQSRPSIESVRECLERVSSTWKPIPPQANEDVEQQESDWNLITLTP